MRSFIGKWGDSLALRLPRHLAVDVRLFAGTEVDLSIRDGSLVVTPARAIGWPTFCGKPERPIRVANTTGDRRGARMSGKERAGAFAREPRLA